MYIQTNSWRMNSSGQIHHKHTKIRGYKIRINPCQELVVRVSDLLWKSEFYYYMANNYTDC